MGGKKKAAKKALIKAGYVAKKMAGSKPAKAGKAGKKKAKKY